MPKPPKKKSVNFQSPKVDFKNMKAHVTKFLGIFLSLLLKQISSFFPDLNLSLATGYPTKNQYKLHQRLVKAYESQGSPKEAQEEIQKLKQSLNSSDLGAKARQEVLKECQKASSKMTQDAKAESFLSFEIIDSQVRDTPKGDQKARDKIILERPVMRERHETGKLGVGVGCKLKPMLERGKQ